MRTIPAVFRRDALASLAAACLLSSTATPGEIPYPEALETSAIVLDRFDDLNRNALLLGNGDLNAMFYQRNGALCLRVSKNDVWDARVDTSRDPDMMKVDIAGWSWKGGGGNIPSWTNPYPNPRSAAIVRFGGAKRHGLGPDPRGRQRQ
ncbi:MAG: hypothetical protein U1F77_17570 [Kiritimatiellia bacterium]